MEYLRRYYFIIFILLFSIIFVFNLKIYERTEEIIKSNYENEIKLIKHNVFNSLKDAFAAYSISEILLNSEMRENSKFLLQKYKHDPNPEFWDLKSLQEEMPDYEIYVIDNSLKIVNTTLAADMGLDFSTKTQFAALLRSRMQSDEFVADKLDLAQNTGLINKYSYQPTPDHNFLLELSINISDRFPILGDFNIFAISKELTQNYSQLNSINFYKFGRESNKVGLLNSSSPSELEVVDSQTKSLVKRAVTNNRVFTDIQKNNGYQLTNDYIPFLVSNEETDSPWWNSFVVRVSYDNQKLINEIDQEKRNFVINMLIIFLVFVFFSTIMTYFIKKTESMAYYDHLTGLLNRKAFEKHFKNKQKKSAAEKMAILYIDLDGFKAVNDNYGHDSGDCLLKLVAERLKNTVRKNDKVSRMGGDEFTVLLSNIRSSLDVKNVQRKIEAKLAEPYEINGKIINISCSIGYSIDYRAEKSFQEMLIRADTAMYKMKNEKN